MVVVGEVGLVMTGYGGTMIIIGDPIISPQVPVPLAAIVAVSY
jgi:hypothetical protein